MDKSRRRRADNVLTLPTAEMNALPQQAATISDSDIARRAYELYERRGGHHGQDVDDWLQAERELQETVSSSAA